MPSIPCSFFQHGVCAKGDVCGFVHNDAMVPPTTRVAICLRDFIDSRGSSLVARSIGTFYKQHPTAKSAIASFGTVSAFCDSHEHLLLFDKSGVGGGTIKSISVAKGAQSLTRTSAVQSTSNKNNGSSSGNAAHALALASFVLSQGGKIQANQIREFYRKHPDAKASLAIGTKRFCDQYPHILRFEVDGGEGCVCATSPEKSHGKAPPNMFYRISGQHVASLLSEFLRNHGGSMHAGTALGKFYIQHPETRSIISKPEQFCSQHADLLHFQPDGASGKLVAVGSMLATPSQPSSMSQREAALMLALFVSDLATPGHCGGVLSEFYKKHSAIKPLLKCAFKDGIHAVCANHSDILTIRDGKLVGGAGTIPRSESNTAPSTSSKTACIRQIALLWNAFVENGRQHLEHEPHEVLKPIYDTFMAEEDTRGTRTNFAHVMTMWRKLKSKNNLLSPQNAIDQSPNALTQTDNLEMHDVSVERPETRTVTDLGHSAAVNDTNVVGLIGITDSDDGNIADRCPDLSLSTEINPLSRTKPTFQCAGDSCETHKDSHSATSSSETPRLLDDAVNEQQSSRHLAEHSDPWKDGGDPWSAFLKGSSSSLAAVSDQSEPLEQVLSTPIELNHVVASIHGASTADSNAIAHSHSSLLEEASNVVPSTSQQTSTQPSLSEDLPSALVHGAVRSATNSLETAAARLQAWEHKLLAKETELLARETAAARFQAKEHKLLAKEAELLAREEELESREALLDAYQLRQQKRLDLQVAIDRLAAASVAEMI